MHTSQFQARLFGLALAVTSVLFAHPSRALRFTPGSACASYCSSTPDSSSSTSTIKASEIVCSNKDYWSSTAGTQYRNCLNCLQNSTAVNETQSDVAWYLYNLRYSLDVCLYAYPSSNPANSSETSTCASSSGCQSLQTALETGITRPSNGTQFDYCTANSAFSTSLETCQQCLQTDTNQSYFSNFLVALDAGCKQQPPAGKVLGLNGTLFSTVAVSIVNPSWNQTASDADSSSSSLRRGTIIGIVAGAGGLLVCALILFYLYWRIQRGSQHQTQDFASPRFRRYTPLGYRALMDNTSSTSGGFAPFYTTDYKGAASSQPNSTVFQHIRPQHVLLPGRQPDELDSAGVPVSSSLWGHDTPVPSRQQMRGAQNNTNTQPIIITHAISSIESHDSFSPAKDAASSIQRMGQGLDEMPTHPAFMPRAFTRPSRNPINPAQPQPHIKAYRPDEYVAQHYVDALRDSTSVNVTTRGMQPPPAPSPYQRDMGQFAASSTADSFASRGYTRQMSSGNTSIASSAASLRSRSISPMSSSVPLIKTPTPPRGRTTKRNVPPPIVIENVRTKAPRMQHPLSHEV